MINVGVLASGTEMKGRVVASLALLVGAKLINVQVPFILKDAIDTLNIAVETGTIATSVPISALIGCNMPKLLGFLSDRLSDSRWSCPHRSRFVF
jgi:hypothetical protein